MYLFMNVKRCNYTDCGLQGQQIWQLSDDAEQVQCAMLYMEFSQGFG